MLSAEINIVNTFVFEHGTPEDINSWCRIKELVEAQATSTNKQNTPCVNTKCFASINGFCDSNMASCYRKK
jgi:hypothetical protein